ncbi:MAG: 2-C-methyl-D-erythritol 2,4-cyclodiphosphate synthase [Paramuribaculum sp.]|nr:2-C-methyl-D-erythritol 2,4-cyclodiphosphate synthase [Paramuribaculum sp.]
MDIPFRTGLGYDVHRLVEDRKLILCGVTIPHTHGLLGHSDADVALHALADALLGAAAMRDIGYHFPDTDAAYAGADSRVLLRRVVELVAEKGYRVGNVDITIVAQAPKLLPYIEQMRDNVAADLGVEPDAVSVKATTTERLGFAGRREGISALATALLLHL